MQAEDRLNTLVSYPLPPAFYEQGGMRNLRERFQPELRTSPKPSRKPSTDGVTNPAVTPASRAQTVLGRDYFNFNPDGSSNNSKAPSLPATTPKAGLENKLSMSPVVQMRPYGNRQETFQKRDSGRKQVGAGDLLSMTTTAGDDDEAYYRPQSRTPGFSRNDTWQAKTPAVVRGTSSNNMARRKTTKRGTTAESLNEEFDLKEAVMTSIAESIGLIQAPNTESALPSGADSMAMSTPTSPLIFGQRHRRGQGSASIRSPFGGLSMLDITRSQASQLGGLQGEEDASHTGTAAESTTGGIEDLENDVQILYFKAGSVLVKEGEANAGL